MGGDERFLPFFGLKLVKERILSSAPNDAVLVNEAFVKNGDSGTGELSVGM